LFSEIMLNRASFPSLPRYGHRLVGRWSSPFYDGKLRVFFFSLFWRDVLRVPPFPPLEVFAPSFFLSRVSRIDSFSFPPPQVDTAGLFFLLSKVWNPFFPEVGLFLFHFFLEEIFLPLCGGIFDSVVQNVTFSFKLEVYGFFFYSFCLHWGCG